MDLFITGILKNPAIIAAGSLLFFLLSALAAFLFCG